MKRALSFIAAAVLSFAAAAQEPAVKVLAAGSLLARMPARAEPIRALSYRLYTLCERKGWAEEARAYNELVTAWSGIEQASADSGWVGSQGSLDI